MVTKSKFQKIFDKVLKENPHLNTDIEYNFYGSGAKKKMNEAIKKEIEKRGK